jgi:hypothetical protein
LRLGLRQLCWAHRKRDFQKRVDRGGAAKIYGEKGLAAVHILFHEWHLFRGGGSRADLQEQLGSLREAVRVWLAASERCRDAKAAALCGNLHAVEPALWTFLYQEGVEPTSNHIERLLRPGVVAEERLWLSERTGLPVRGAHPDGGADVAAAAASHPGLSVSVVVCSSQWRPSPESATGRVNGYAPVIGSGTVATMEDGQAGKMSRKRPTMTRVIVDPTTEAKLRDARQTLELCDRSGCVLGHFVPVRAPSNYRGIDPQISEEELDRREQEGDGRSLADILADRPRSPFSDEEIQRRRQQKEGRPLAELLRDLTQTGSP